MRKQKTRGGKENLRIGGKLKYDPLTIFRRSATPAGLYIRSRWIGTNNDLWWQKDFKGTVESFRKRQEGQRLGHGVRSAFLSSAEITVRNRHFMRGKIEKFHFDLTTAGECSLKFFLIGGSQQARVPGRTLDCRRSPRLQRSKGVHLGAESLGYHLSDGRRVVAATSCDASASSAVPTTPRTKTASSGLPVHCRGRPHPPFQETVDQVLDGSGMLR